MNARQAEMFHRLCDDPSVCNANAYFFVVNGEGTPAVDWMCHRDFEDNGCCWCGKLDAAHNEQPAEARKTRQSDGSACGDR